MINNTQKEKNALKTVEISYIEDIRKRFDILLECNKLRQIDLANLLGKENPLL